MKTSRWIATALVGAVFFTGTLVPFSAWAQSQQAEQPQAQPAQPMPMPMPPPPPPMPPRPGAPLNDKLEPAMTDRQPAAMGYTILPPDADQPSGWEPTQLDAVEAGIFNILYVPTKAITCLVAGGVAVAVLGLSAGSGYRPASGVINEGCGGAWYLTGDHISGKIPGPGDGGYQPGNRSY